MNHTKTQNNWLLIFGVPILLLVSLLLLVSSESFKQNASQLSLAITLDLVFTIPIVYFFLIRKSSIDKKTVVPFFYCWHCDCQFYHSERESGSTEYY